MAYQSVKQSKEMLDGLKRNNTRKQYMARINSFREEIEADDEPEYDKYIGKFDDINEIEDDDLRADLKDELREVLSLLQDD